MQFLLHVILSIGCLHCILIPSSPLFSLPPKVFGGTYYVHNLGPGFKKLDTCVLLNASFFAGYQCYSPVLRGHFTSADVIFLESRSYFFIVSSLDGFVFVSPPFSFSYPEYLTHFLFRVIACTISCSLISLLCRPRPSALVPTLIFLVVFRFSCII
jgi:hypothetical protein